MIQVRGIVYVHVKVKGGTPIEEGVFPSPPLDDGVDRSVSAPDSKKLVYTGRCTNVTRIFTLCRNRTRKG